MRLEEPRGYHSTLNHMTREKCYKVMNTCCLYFVVIFFVIERERTCTKYVHFLRLRENMYDLTPKNKERENMYEHIQNT